MRRTDRELTDREEIKRILEEAKVLRLGLKDGDYPYIVPLHYGYVYEGDVLRFYMHGAKAGKKYELVKADSHAFVELDCAVETTGEAISPVSTARTMRASWRAERSRWSRIPKRRLRDLSSSCGRRPAETLKLRRNRRRVSPCFRF